MGGWHVGCALCGAVAEKPHWEGGQGQDSYNAVLISRDETEWMGDVRILSEDSELISPTG